MFIWLVYAIVALLLLGSSASVVHYLQPSQKSNFASTANITLASTSVFSSYFISASSIAAITLSLLTLFLVPIDVYVVEHSLNENFRMTQQVLAQFYQITLMILVAYSSIVAPLAYNYAKQREMAHVTLIFDTKQHLKLAVKRTLCMLIGISLLFSIFTVLLLCGRPKNEPRVDWIKALIKFSYDFETFVQILVGTLILCGLYIWIFVCARGLAHVPLVGLLMEDHSEEQATSDGNTFQELLRENDMEREAIEQTQIALHARYIKQPGQTEPDPVLMSVADQERLHRIKLRKEQLSARQQVLEDNMRRTLRSRRRWKCWRIPLGLICLCLSVSIIISVLTTNVEKLLRSDFRQGFVTDRPSHLTVIDALLVASSQFFPMDYILFGILFYYIFIVSFRVLMQGQVHLLCLQFGWVKPRLTAASTVTLASLVMVYVVLICLFSLLTIAPQYASFGHQTFVDAETNQSRMCTLKEAAAGSHCRVTRLAEFYNSMVLSMPTFGLLFFLGQWLFAFSFIPWSFLAYSLAKPLKDPDPKMEKLLGNC
uniref:Uncharacterized protein AlNc14C168G7927 n=1 Tax=Albugo laibachii Nc14 TaxID=890382 RepID=F0WN95_9STRA|nr:conserved hypothetical protein [Albugo laibachii Nc14]|eukprot:CCA22784.1 conserved hypothetical protein [Albugo laibachii Nc14]